MLFSAHREDHVDDGYDSLWSDSDEEWEDPNDTIGFQDDEEQFTSIDESVNLHSSRRRSLLEEYIPNNYKPRKSPSSISPNATPRTGNRRSMVVSVLTQEQMNADLNQLQDMMENWSTNFTSKYREQNQRDNEYVEQQRTQIKKHQKSELVRSSSRLDLLKERRNKNLQEMLNQRRRLQELIEKERREEEERKRREEEERKRKEEEERKRKQEEERKKREEEERKRREKEELEQKQLQAKLEKERKAQEAAEAAEEAARKEKEQQEAARKEAAAKEKQAAAAFPSDDQINEEFARYKQQIADIKSQIVEPVSNVKELKNYCFKAKRRVKPKVGQLTTSRSQVRTITSEVNAVFAECQQADQKVYQWILNFFAKAVVQQAETEVAAAPNTAHPLGILAVQCMQEHPQLVDFMVARFVKKCPHLIGYSCPTDTDEGRKRMGWKQKGEGVWEDESQYADRMAGISAVWAIITLVKFGAASGKKHPYPIKHQWIFLSRLVNKQPSQLSNAAFSAVAAWWDVSAERFLQAFGKQGHKLLTLVWDDWTQSVADKRFPGAARLRLLGEDWQKTGKACTGPAAMTN